MRIKPETPLMTQISLIRQLCRINDTEKLEIVEIHWDWWYRGYDCELFDDGLLDEYRCRSDKHFCYFRDWLDKTEDEIYKEVTA